MTTIFSGGRVLGADRGELIDGLEVAVDGERIVEVSETPIASGTAERIDLAGKTLMPGLIDCHVHVVSHTVDLWQTAMAPSSLAALRAGRIMHRMLPRMPTSWSSTATRLPISAFWQATAPTWRRSCAVVSSSREERRFERDANCP